MPLMLRFLSRYEPLSYNALRVVAGLMFAFHGMQKVLGILTEKQPAFGTQAWFGGVIELVAGIAIAVGYRAALAAFLASGTMAVAYVQFHWKLDLGARFFPTINKGELAALYAFLFLFIACKESHKAR